MKAGLRLLRSHQEVRLLPVERGHAPHLWVLLARELWRRLRRRLRTGPVYRWRYSGRTPERVLIAPPDLRLADPQIATEIYHGRFPFAGHVVEASGRSPFSMNVSSRAWVETLHGFGWLRHMQAADTELAAANARALVSDWISVHGGRISGLAWEPSVTARRIISWLQHSSIVLHGAELPFYRSFLKLLKVQIRYLRTMAPEMAEGEERLCARIALAFAALSLPAPPSALRSATRNLAVELDRQILPDGGHISRNPAALLELLADLLPLRETYANQAEAPPNELIGAIERMLPALRFFRHQEGSLARFNGAGLTPHDRVAAILHHDDTGGAPLLHAPHSGYERLSVGGTTVIADTGLPPPWEISREAHAGCLSFEMSSGRQQFIVNAGVDDFGPEEFRPLARATAAHSTATINDASSCRFEFSPRLQAVLGSPLISGPRQVSSARNDRADRQGFIASHDGYVSRFGLFHERELVLSADGNVLDGADRFLPPEGGQGRFGCRNDLVNIRFHLHPDIGLYHDEENRLMLKPVSGEAWLFNCPALDASIEETLFFAGLAGATRSHQIVLSYRAAEIPEVRWRFTRLK